MLRVRLICALAAALALGAPDVANAAFTFESHRLDSALRKRVTGSSWHQGCPVGLADLRYLRISYYGFDRRTHVGELMVAATSVEAMRTAFSQLYDHRFPVRRMRLVDNYGASDFKSIEADNTSAFNCRRATGSTRWSEHAYGRALDINPIENPYVYGGGKTDHPDSRPYLDRHDHRRGMAFRGGALVRAFTAAGWGWGGLWPEPTDYQHFSATGR